MDESTKLRNRLIKLGRIKPGHSIPQKKHPRQALIEKGHIVRPNPEWWGEELSYQEAYRRFFYGIGC